jgi:hypothetical protein
MFNIIASLVECNKKKKDLDAVFMVRGFEN